MKKISKILTNLSEKQKKWITFGLAVFLSGLMLTIAICSSYGALGIPGDSGTTDEVAHIPSGYSYIKYLDYRLNPEHPPLAKALSGLSLVIHSGFNGFQDNWTWNAIDQWDAGWYFLYNAGNNPAQVLFWARLPMMLLMIGLGLFLFKWSKELWGRKVGLFVLLLYSFYPDVIAHGRLVTTDVAAAFGFVVATYYFDKYLKNQTTKTMIFAALALACAQLLKFSAVLLYGIFIFYIIVKAFMEKENRQDFWAKFWKYFKGYFWIGVISLLVIWAVYTPFTWNTPASIEHKLIETNLTSDSRTQNLRAFEHLFENSRFTRGLGHYLLGIMLVVARVAGGNATYIMGYVSDKSISWFFPVAWLIKTPIPILVLFFSSIIFLFKKPFKDSKKDKWLLWLFLTPFVVYWAFTLKGQLNIGTRHLMPTVPFILLMIGYLASKVFTGKLKWPKYALGTLATYLIISTMSFYPCFLSYFNETVPRDQRYQYLVDSALDWGQDLLRLQKYIEDNNIDSIKVDYFGGSQPNYYIKNSTKWHSSNGPTTGWLAVSAEYYQSSKLYGPKEGIWSYEWLDNFKPVKIVGGSILVYHITDQDLAEHPPISSYQIKKITYPAEN